MSTENILAALPSETPHAGPPSAEYWDGFRERLVPQKTVRKLRGDVSNMTLYRHVKKKIVPPPIVIDGRNYWTLGEILDANEADKNRRQQQLQQKGFAADYKAANNFSPTECETK